MNNELKYKAVKYSDSITSCRQVARQIDDLGIDKEKIAIISNFTLNGLSECIKAKSFIDDLVLDVYEGKYGQWRQEVLGDGLFNFNPKIIFLFNDFVSIEEDAFFNYMNNDHNYEYLFDLKLDQFIDYVELIKNKTSAKIVITNAVKPAIKLWGIIEERLSKNISDVVNRINLKLIEKYKYDKQVYVFDFDGWLSDIGKKSNWYSKYFYIADMRLSPDAFPLLAQRCVDYIYPILGKRKKCIILDLDNTLWGGVIGEDGIGSISISPNGNGMPFYFFQKVLLNYKRMGFLLAINSRNNRDDVINVFRNHPDMVLKEEDFVSMRINWDDKASNILSIANELNIGIDSIVFIDDDPVNRELVKQKLPEVKVLDLPSDPNLYMSALFDCSVLNISDYTEEDKNKSEMYMFESKRDKIRVDSISIDDFLKQLDLSVIIKEVNDLTIDRVSQLTQKTNQFNLTTKRYQIEDIKNMINSGHKIWTIEVFDKFGKYGIVGVCIVLDRDDYWEIDTFLLSCRVLGRKIEEVFLSSVLDRLKLLNKDMVKASYIQTEKNNQVKDFYKNFNFKRVSSGTACDIWQFDLSDLDKTNYKFIKVLE